MEAPEKIYIYPSDMVDGEYYDLWFEGPLGEGYVEYTRTDTFIEKAYLYLFENYHGEKLSLKMIENFVKYMKGE